MTQRKQEGRGFERGRARRGNFILRRRVNSAPCVRAQAILKVPRRPLSRCHGRLPSYQFLQAPSSLFHLQPALLSSSSGKMRHLFSISLVCILFALILNAQSATAVHNGELEVQSVSNISLSLPHVSLSTLAPFSFVSPSLTPTRSPLPHPTRHRIHRHACPYPRCPQTFLSQHGRTYHIRSVHGVEEAHAAPAAAPDQAPDAEQPGIPDVVGEQPNIEQGPVHDDPLDMNDDPPPAGPQIDPRPRIQRIYHPHLTGTFLVPLWHSYLHNSPSHR